MIYITGDCHADFTKFSTRRKPKKEMRMSKGDIVIICGDFGVWHDTNEERYWFNWLDRKPFTTVFVDGNHENFDRLYSNEFPVVDFHGGKAHKIRDNVYHLMRGYVFEFEGKKFFAFGGASSHDIKDGILNPDDYPSLSELVKDYNRRTAKGEMLRINHISWWEQEMPSREEMDFGLKTLAEHDFKVDYIVTHCCPQHVASYFSHGTYKPDELTKYFNEIAEKTKFKKWYFGHYHNDYQVFPEYQMLYHSIIRVI